MRLINLHKQFVNLRNLPFLVFRWDENRKQKEKEKEEEEEEQKEKKGESRKPRRKPTRRTRH